MSIETTSGHWSLFAGNERALLGRHVNAVASRRPPFALSVPRKAAADDISSLTPLIPIGFLTLFMLWAVISPL